MPLNTTGAVNTKIDKLRTLLSQSATFQAAVPGGTAAEVLNHIYDPTITETQIEQLAGDPGQWPLAVISLGGIGWRRIGRAAGDDLRPDGRLIVGFYRLDKAGETVQSAGREFHALHAEIVKELNQLAGSDGRFSYREIRTLEEPGRTPLAIADEDLGAYWGVRYAIDWGDTP